jgi:sirohydrochlorin cobaltochelatase
VEDGMTIVPVFLGQGGHCCATCRCWSRGCARRIRDWPSTVAGAVGEDPAVLQAMTDYCVAAFSRKG